MDFLLQSLMDLWEIRQYWERVEKERNNKFENDRRSEEVAKREQNIQLLQQKKQQEQLAKAAQKLKKQAIQQQMSTSKSPAIIKTPISRTNSPVTPRLPSTLMPRNLAQKTNILPTPQLSIKPIISGLRDPTVRLNSLQTLRGSTPRAPRMPSGTMLSLKPRASTPKPGVPLSQTNVMYNKLMSQGKSVEMPTPPGRSVKCVICKCFLEFICMNFFSLNFHGQIVSNKLVQL